MYPSYNTAYRIYGKEWCVLKDKLLCWNQKEKQIYITTLAAKYSVKKNNIDIIHVTLK